jgi:hypothetical protein
MSGVFGDIRTKGESIPYPISRQEKVQKDLYQFRGCSNGRVKRANRGCVPLVLLGNSIYERSATGPPGFPIQHTHIAGSRGECPAPTSAQERCCQFTSPGITATAQENPASDDLPSIWDCGRTHQTPLGVLQRSVQRPKLTPADLWLWAWLCAVWNDWQ